MKQQVIDSLQHILPGAGGAGVIEVLHQTQPDNTGTLIIQAIVGIVSLIPTFKAIFKRKPKV